MLRWLAIVWKWCHYLCVAFVWFTGTEQTLLSQAVVKVARSSRGLMGRRRRWGGLKPEQGGLSPLAPLTLTTDHKLILIPYKLNFRWIHREWLQLVTLTLALVTKHSCMLPAQTFWLRRPTIIYDRPLHFGLFFVNCVNIKVNYLTVWTMCSTTYAQNTLFTLLYVEKWSTNMRTML